ncbi:hybrid sensor histidine kinase/response regulator transcription factor [Sporolactobacillus laevolacticus]|uniref:hybrid sensor histidine kinase/response regulator transcription factor n=1 Tax=Sporolactobacillus laevolacticus TaxID=33018 RepID=UPI0025B5FC50|nr:hybrid sensor histidine kinase/response regulator transcription factor [Sporolactobacillus laevolacticus]MDN3956159.1 hybrid sensor histidine kinase/response regulator transcription factor [Sporolactobacillus laevolacticus]
MPYLSKYMFISCLNIVIIALVLTFVSYEIQGRMILKNIQEQSAYFTDLAFDRLNPEDIRRADQNPDLNAPAQKTLTRQLSIIAENNSDVGQAYIFNTKITNGDETKVLAMPTKLIEAENGTLLPGMQYRQPQEVIEAIKKLTREKTMIKTGVYTDRYGTWVTVLYPVFDRSNHVYAYFGVDMDASIIKKAQNSLLMLSLFLTAIILLVVLITQYLVMKRMLQPVKKIFTAIHQASLGSGQYLLEENRKGDIGDINKKFNYMARLMQLAEKYKQLLSENKEQIAHIMKQNEQLTAYAKQVERLTVNEERARLAQEWHDTIGHRLTSLIMGMDVIQRLFDVQPDEAREKMGQLSQIARESLEDVRRSVHILSAIDHTDQSLTAGLSKIIEEFQLSTEMSIIFHHPDKAIDTLDQVKLTFVRCLQEALTNSIRHGKATSVVVRLVTDDRRVSLTIRDNGVSKDPITFGFGLRGMKARLEALNGALTVEKNDQDAGITLSCSVPLQGALSRAKIRLLIVDDQVLIRESLSALLDYEEDFVIAGMASDGEEAIEISLKEEPDIILLDIQLPKMSGIDVLKKLKEKMPSVKVIMLTTFSNLDYAKEVIAYGAEGYLLKSISPQQLAQSIRLIYRGGTLLSQNLAQSLVLNGEEERVDAEAKRQSYDLSAREAEILGHLVKGLTYADIAEIVGLSKGTVKNYVSTIYSKLFVANRSEAMNKVMEEGLI